MKISDTECVVVLHCRETTLDATYVMLGEGAWIAATIAETAGTRLVPSLRWRPEADLWCVLDVQVDPLAVKPEVELAELLSWATAHRVIDEDDRSCSLASPRLLAKRRIPAADRGAEGCAQGRVERRRGAARDLGGDGASSGTTQHVGAGRGVRTTDVGVSR